MELFIVGLLFGALMGALIMRNHRESRIEKLEEIMRKQHELILLQERYIKQEDKERTMMIAERARRLEKHCHMTNRLEMMTSNGMLVVKVFDDHGKAVRVTYKDGEPVDIQKANPELLRPIKSNDVTFGGF